MGGAFLQREGEPWPSDPVTGNQYYPVIQILKSDLRKAGTAGDPVFPFQKGTDCFQLLWLPPANDELPPTLLTRWLDSNDRALATHEVPYQPGGSDMLFPQECRLHPEEVVEYPSRWALSEYHKNLLLSNGRFMRLAEAHGDADNPLAFYQTHLSCAPGTKLAGHPHWIQYPEWPISDRGLAMEHLLTVSSREWDAGDYSRWKPAKDGNPDTAEGCAS
jgi:hypothetical protein